MKRGMEGTLEALRKKGRGGKRKVAEEEEDEESAEDEGGMGGGDDEDEDMVVSFPLSFSASSSTPTFIRLNLPFFLPVPTLIFTTTSTLSRQPPLNRRSHNSS